MAGTMPKLLNMTLLLLGGLVASASFSVVDEHSGAWLPAGLGLGLVVAAYVGDHRVEARRARWRHFAAMARVRRITTATVNNEQTLQAHRTARWLLPPLLLASLGVFVIWGAWFGIAHSWAALFPGVPLLFLGVFQLSRTVAGIGGPVLGLLHSGFVTPLSGPIPWSEVEGIHHNAVTYRGYTRHSLCFEIPRYALLVRSPHWTERFLGFFGKGPLKRGRLVVGLNGLGESPDVIHALACHLWKMRTGRDP